MCLNISALKPVWQKNDKQGDPETADRDELILVLYNSRHSDGVLFMGGIISERRCARAFGAAGGGRLMANRQVFTESRTPNLRVSMERYRSAEHIPAQLMRGKVKE